MPFGYWRSLWGHWIHSQGASGWASAFLFVWSETNSCWRVPWSAAWFGSESFRLVTEGSLCLSIRMHFKCQKTRRQSFASGRAPFYPASWHYGWMTGGWLTSSLYSVCSTGHAFLSLAHRQIIFKTTSHPVTCLSPHPMPLCWEHWRDWLNRSSFDSTPYPPFQSTPFAKQHGSVCSPLQSPLPHLLSSGQRSCSFR